MEDTLSLTHTCDSVYKHTHTSRKEYAFPYTDTHTHTTCLHKFVYYYMIFSLFQIANALSCCGEIASISNIQYNSLSDPMKTGPLSKTQTAKCRCLLKQFLYVRRNASSSEDPRVPHYHHYNHNTTITSNKAGNIQCITYKPY